MTTNFIHLRTHSSYSLAQGAIKTDLLAELCLQNKMPALGITDRDNLFGALEIALLLSKSGIQPIIGVEIAILSPKEESLKNQQPQFDTLVLLSQSVEGYKNLMFLVSLASKQGASLEQPFLNMQDLEGRTEGLIALTASIWGGVAKRLLAKQKDAASQYLDQLKNLFPDRLYIELTRLGYSQEEMIEADLIEFAYSQNLPLVATNNVYFSKRELFEAHDALLCVADGTYVVQDDRRRMTPEHYFKSAAQMKELFKDLPEAIENTLQIAQRCYFMPEVSKPILPAYPTQGGRSEEDELRFKAQTGLMLRLEKQVYQNDQHDDEKEQIKKRYFDRLEYELGIINQMGFPGYFLIVSDFIQWAKSQDIPVGPGRGSGAGSLVAWSLTITDIDPIRFGLIFERFLNPERVSMPDFDVDFCQDRRDEVIDYVRRKYGDDRVAHIITFGKLQARAVLRDVGRVLQMPYGQVDRICKMIPNNPAAPVTLQQALDQDPALRQEMRNDETVDRLIKIALQLEGLYRHASTHAAGVVIGDRSLTDLVPLFYDPESKIPATQFNMKYVEQAGLLKFDFLGLKTLTVLAKALAIIKKTQKVDVDLSQISLDDKNTFALLHRVEAIGVFQLESAGMRDVLSKLKPDHFEEIIALIALYRPGPMDDIPRYLACKHGLEEVVYAHPLLEDILAESYGVMVVQEQVMRIAQVMAGYSLGAADLLRRAMGKKNRQEMDEQRSRFVQGSVANGVKDATASQIFDQIAKFAGYGFNKSHAAPYALLTYQTAYLKANYPVEFMCALMTLDLHNTDKLNVFRQELKRMKIELLLPDINLSYAEFFVEKDSSGHGAIRYALAALKNVGLNAMEAIVDERKKNGNFSSVFDFVKRMSACDAKVLNKRQMEHLIMAGVFDSLYPNRKELFDNLELILKSQSRSEDKQQGGLFAAESHDENIKLVKTSNWSFLEKLDHEFSAVGFYLSSHPLDSYEKELNDLNVCSASKLADLLEGKEQVNTKLAGVILTKKERSSKSGNRFAFVQCSDATAQFEVTIFSDVLALCREKLVEGQAFLFDVAARSDGESLRITVYDAKSLEDVLSGASLSLKLMSKDSLLRLKTILDGAKEGVGRIDLFIKAENTGEELKFLLDKNYHITANLRAQLLELENVR